MKADREVLVGTTREYSAYVSNWQKETANASIKMIERIRESNKQLRFKDEEIESLKMQVENLKSSFDTSNTNDKAVKNLEAEIQKLKEIVELKDRSIEEEKEAQKKLKAINISSQQQSSDHRCGVSSGRSDDCDRRRQWTDPSLA